jgi:hypothetical protein
MITESRADIDLITESRADIEDSEVQVSYNPILKETFGD